MAKKKRTPPPSRPVQAPRRRYEPTTRGDFSRRAKIVGAGLAGALAVGIAIAVAATRGGGSGDPTKALAAAGCSFKTYTSQGQQHVQSVNARVKYNSFPPTSGPHYFQPAIWGNYSSAGSPLNLVQEVHNLEHGGVIIQFGNSVPSATVEQLDAFYGESPNGLLIAPLPKLSDKIALTAWTHLATCPRFDESAFKAFRDAYRGKGPERIPLSQLTPGS